MVVIALDVVAFNLSLSVSRALPMSLMHGMPGGGARALVSRQLTLSCYADHFYRRPRSTRSQQYPVVCAGLLGMQRTLLEHVDADASHATPI